MNDLAQLAHIIKTLKKYEVIEIRRDKDNPSQVSITIKSTERHTIDVPYSDEA